MRQRRKGGFTLIELVIVIAIIGIIAAIGIPNILQARIAANQSHAKAALVRYGNAQTTWRMGGFAAIAGNNGAHGADAKGAVTDADEYERSRGNRAYCDNLQNLYYGLKLAGGADETRIIPADIAHAHLGKLGKSAATRNAKAPARQSYNGYQFREDAFMDTPSANRPMLGWNTAYGLIAYPSAAGHTGTYAFWIGRDNVVMMAYKQDELFASTESPYDANGVKQWDMAH